MHIPFRAAVDRDYRSLCLADRGEFCDCLVLGFALVVGDPGASWHPDLDPEPVIVSNRLLDLAQAQIIDGCCLDRVQPRDKLLKARLPLSGVLAGIRPDLGSQCGKIAGSMHDGAALTDCDDICADLPVPKLPVDRT